MANVEFEGLSPEEEQGLISWAESLLSLAEEWDLDAEDEPE